MYCICATVLLTFHHLSGFLGIECTCMLAFLNFSEVSNTLLKRSSASCCDSRLSVPHCLMRPFCGTQGAGMQRICKHWCCDVIRLCNALNIACWCYQLRKYHTSSQSCAKQRRPMCASNRDLDSALLCASENYILQVIKRKHDKIN
jgi:hypothetical protein